MSAKIFYADMRTKLSIICLISGADAGAGRNKTGDSLEGCPGGNKNPFRRGWNLSYIHPGGTLCGGLVKDKAAQPFLTDSNSLYIGSRSDAVRHCARHIRTDSATRCKAYRRIISGWLAEYDVRQVEVNLKHFSKVDLGAEVTQAQPWYALPFQGP